MLVMLLKPMSWAYLGVNDESGIEKYAPPGLYGIDYPGFLTIA
jgi:hypothetical protein